MTPLNSSDKLDELFRNNLKNIRQEAPKKTWGQVREQLNATNRAPWTSYAEGFVMICVVAAIMYGLYTYVPSKMTASSSLDEKKASISMADERNSSSQIAPSNSEAQVKKSTPTSVAAIQPEFSKSQSVATTSSNTFVEEEKIKPSSTAPSNLSVSKKRNRNSGSASIQHSAIAAKLINETIESGSESTELNSLPAFTEPMNLVAMLNPEPSVVIKNNSFNTSTMERMEFTGGSRDDYSNRNKTRNEFHVGLSYFANNTWIINQNTYGEFNGSELNYKVDFGSAYGFQVGYDFKQKYGIQFELNMNSLQGQKYEDQLYFGRVTREVSLKYNSFPLIFKYKTILVDKAKLKINCNYLVGIQMDKLLSAEITNNDNTFDATSRFRKTNYAGILGLETNTYVLENVYFSIGARASMSNDINDKKYPVNNTSGGMFDNYKHSNNVLLGVNAGLHYVFLK